jgi:hypothetical protein
MDNAPTFPAALQFMADLQFLRLMWSEDYRRGPLFFTLAWVYSRNCRVPFLDPCHAKHFQLPSYVL